jgi:hypothetical protein
VMTGADPRIDCRLQAVCDAAAGMVRRNLRRVSVAEVARKRSRAGVRPSVTSGRRVREVIAAGRKALPAGRVLSTTLRVKA